MTQRESDIEGINFISSIKPPLVHDKNLDEEVMKKDSMMTLEVPQLSGKHFEPTTSVRDKQKVMPFKVPL